MGELHGIHAADLGAILVVVVVAAAHAVDDGYRLRLGATIQHDLAVGWPRSIDQPLKLKASDYTFQPPIAILVQG